MEEKKYGVKMSLITSLKKFQSSLRKPTTNMPYLGYAEVFYNGRYGSRLQVEAENRRLSLIPSLLALSLKIPPQQLVNNPNSNSVRLILSDWLTVCLEFDNDDEKCNFLSALGDLNVDTDSLDSDSLEREN